MPVDEIHFFNRYTGQVETEAVYGDKWLRWTLHSPFGRMAMHLVAKRAWFARWYGRQMDSPASLKKVQPFIEQYDLDISEFASHPDEFKSFNEFFYRKLNPEARPIDNDPSSMVFPADGRHLGYADISKADNLFVKGNRFNLPQLLGSKLADRYHEGSAVFSRLCPVDYHRFHFPAAGIPSVPKLMQGHLKSVNIMALRRHLSTLWENQRSITELKTDQWGSVLIIEIGATNVGSIRQTYNPDDKVEKGSEKGYFAFGGSAMLVLFEKGQIQLAPDLLEQTAQQRELYAHMGDKMATAV